MIAKKLAVTGVFLAACGGVHAVAQYSHAATSGQELAQSSEAAAVLPPPSFMDLVNQAWSGPALPIYPERPELLAQQLKIIPADFSPSSALSAPGGLALPVGATSAPTLAPSSRTAGGATAESAERAARQNTMQRSALFALPSVPEPSAWMLLCCGLVFAAFIAWRKSSYVA
jgi:hypothetical protein